jgi:hypothetical protein
MIVLALLKIDENTACDAICQVAAARVPVPRRLRIAMERVLRGRPDAVRVRWARLARQDREEMVWRLSQGRR